MLYAEFMNRACDMCIYETEEGGMFYLIPYYKKLLKDVELNVEEVTDYNLTIEEVKEYLDLEIDFRNKVRNPMPEVGKWLLNVINYVVDPIIEKQNNDLALNIIDYLKLSEDAKNKLLELSEKDEKEIKTNKDLSRINFTKKQIS